MVESVRLYGGECWITSIVESAGLYGDIGYMVESVGLHGGSVGLHGWVLGYMVGDFHGGVLGYKEGVLDYMVVCWVTW